jgi:phage baseplate assembly protein W
MSAYPERPHLAFPFARDPTSGSVGVVEQNSVEHIMSCEMVIVNHPLGYRTDRPEFGWAWPELAGVPLDLGSLEQALRQFEPRGSASATQYADAALAAVQHVSVDVAIQSTEAKG